MLSLAQENPAQHEIEQLLRQSDEHAASLYPAESNHPVDVDALSANNIRFFVARWARAGGCGAMVINQDDGSAETEPDVRHRERSLFGRYAADPLSVFMENKLWPR